MKYPLALAALILAPALAQAPATILIPREKVSLSCQDTYFKSVRENFLLLDETYPTCTLKMPLALHERWPGVRTFYVIPRVSASLHSKNSKGEGKWQPLSPLVNPGPDPHAPRPQLTRVPGHRTDRQTGQTQRHRRAEHAGHSQHRGKNHGVRRPHIPG